MDVGDRRHIQHDGSGDRQRRRDADVESAVVQADPPAGRVNVALAANGGNAVASTTTPAIRRAVSSMATPGPELGRRRRLGGRNAAECGPTGWKCSSTDPSRSKRSTCSRCRTTTARQRADAEHDVHQVRAAGLHRGVLDGRAWEPVPGGTVINNTRVWRQFNFAPVTTSRIRVWVTRALGSRSRLIEVEAYAVAGAQNSSPNVTVTGPAAGSDFAVSTPVTLQATATDVDGTVNHVNFYANGTLVGADTESVAGAFTTTWTSALAGTFSITAEATDDEGATGTSTPVAITFTPPPGRINVALAANGGTAVASSTDGSGFPASGVINGDRRGLNWGAGGGWQDGTAGVWPDWLEVQFNGPQLIEQIDVFSVQDNYTAPTVPTLSMTFTKYGLQDFAVEYWTGEHMAGSAGRKRVE